MAYYATREVFPADITGLIMSYMGHNQERWAKYWKDQFIKCMKSEFKILELDTNITSDVLGYVVISEKNNIIDSMMRHKYKFIMGMEFELNKIRDHSVINTLSFNKPNIIKQALMKLL